MKLTEKKLKEHKMKIIIALVVIGAVIAYLQQ